MQIKAERGYLIPAVNSDDTDYLACACHLAHGIRQWHPDAKIAVLTETPVTDPVFDYVVSLPFGDRATDPNWKLDNDWQVFHASPFRQTLKLESDMWCTGPIDHWWTLFEQRDVVVSQGCRTFYDTPGTSRYYRKIFDNNGLPDVYNGITYWRVSQTAQEFFGLVKQIFENWDSYKKLLKMPDERATTDVVYGMAAVIMGPERITLPVGLGPTMVHMKKRMIPVSRENWTEELVAEQTDPGVRINTVAQWGLVHYHTKDFNK